MPETLQALIAARLDGLAPEERTLVQDAAVLGRTFTLRGLAAVTGPRTRPSSSRCSASLMRKEVLSLQADPLLARAGPVRLPPGPRQEGRLRDALAQGAEATAPRGGRDLRALGDEDEIVEVVAAHYLDAYRAAPDDPDAEDVKAEARDDARSRRRAGRVARRERRGAVARSSEAAELTDDAARPRRSCTSAPA